MIQVEGGDLLVFQRGTESRSASESTAGWHDGPWWRSYSEVRSINAIQGLAEAEKLVVANAEGFSKEFYNSNGGLENAMKLATETLNEDNPVRKSDIFLAIQACNYTSNSIEGSAQDSEELTTFIVSILDSVHSISFTTVSQALPRQWLTWLDSTPSADSEGTLSHVPDDIAEIISAGGIDPREWVAEWVEETITLAVGITAQRYVARRMGVGLSKGKRKVEESIEGVSGDAATAT
jgi:hypothetical protein